MCCSQHLAHPISCPAPSTGLEIGSSQCVSDQEGLVDPDLGCLLWLLGGEGSCGNLQAAGVALHVLVNTRMFPPGNPNTLGWGF